MWDILEARPMWGLSILDILAFVFAGLAATAILLSAIQANKRIAETNERASAANERASAANERAAALEKEAAQAQASIAEANERASRAVERAASAEERAAEANRETERLRQGASWRLLRLEQKARITDAMKGFKGQQFAILTYRDDLESSNLGALVKEALIAAGWKYIPSQPLNWLVSRVSIEIAELPDAVTKIGPLAAKLVATLNAEGIATDEVHAPKYNKYPSVIFVVVGKKPPTGIDIPGQGLILDPGPLRE
jgi:hypothetical protein